MLGGSTAYIPTVLIVFVQLISPVSDTEYIIMSFHGPTPLLISGYLFWSPSYLYLNTCSVTAQACWLFQILMTQVILSVKEINIMCQIIIKCFYST